MALSDRHKAQMRVEDFRSAQIAYLLYLGSTSAEGRRMELVDFMPTAHRSATSDREDEADTWEEYAANLRRMTEGTDEDYGTYRED